MTPSDLADYIVATCRELGFHRVGICPVESPRRYESYQEWLRDEMHGSMAYMADPGHQSARRDLNELLDGAETLVVVALAYAKGTTLPMAESPHGFVARYARGADYHQVLKQKLHELATRIRDVAGTAVACRPLVDSAPILEREWAERAGIGFVAKNTMLIAPGLGSYVVLGELLLTARATPTAEVPSETRCGQCTACLDACPTGAFRDPYVLDARRCISYWTIEAKGAIPRDLRSLMGNMIFGCDICQEVCPFNAKAPDRVTPAPELAPRETGASTRTLVELLTMGTNQRKRMIDSTPLRRVNREQLLRNVCVALGNSGDKNAVPPLVAALFDKSPLVRGHAAWALGQLGEREALASALSRETDPLVREELTHAAG